MKRFYFDYAAATPVDPRVVKVMEPYWQKVFANPSSLHEEGRSALQVIDTAREKIAKELLASKEEIFFTSGGSESDNWAILGVARARQAEGKHIIISSIEHKAVLYAAKYLQNNGFEIDICPVDKNGLLDLEQLERLVKKETILVSVIFANNEIGTIQDIAKIAKIVKKKNSKTYLHTDACQAVNYLDLDVDKLGIDLMTINASKIYGPRGIGVLYIKKGVEIEPLIFGGGQEMGRRAGTENIAGVVGMAESLIITGRIRQSESKRLQYLRDKIILTIKKEVPEAILNGDGKNRLPNNISFSFAGTEGESLVLYLDNQGFGVSTGSACSAADLNPSHVLLALGQSKELAHGSLRITLGRWTSEEAVDKLLEVLPEVVAKVRSMSAIYKNSSK